MPPSSARVARDEHRRRRCGGGYGRRTMSPGSTGPRVPELLSGRPPPGVRPERRVLAQGPELGQVLGQVLVQGPVLAPEQADQGRVPQGRRCGRLLDPVAPVSPGRPCATRSAKPGAAIARISTMARYAAKSRVPRSTPVVRFHSLLIVCDPLVPCGLCHVPDLAPRKTTRPSLGWAGLTICSSSDSGDRGCVRRIRAPCTRSKS